MSTRPILSADARHLLTGCFGVIAGKTNHGLPEQLAGYIRGELHCEPEALTPSPHVQGLLRLFRDLHEERLDELAIASAPPSSRATLQAEFDAKTERSTAEALALLKARIELQRIAQASRRSA